MMKTEVTANPVVGPGVGYPVVGDVIPSPSAPQHANYGRLLHQIEEHIEKGKFEFTTSQLHVRFYETVIVFEQTEKFLCYPEAFTISTIPKYRIRNIVVSKAQVPKWLVYAGAASVIIGIVLFIVGGQKKSGSGSGSSSNGGSGSGSGGNQDNSGENAGGAILFIGGLIALAMPFFLNKYFVTLTLALPKASPSLFHWLFPRTEETLTFRVKERPNDAFLMDYALGSLKTGMEEMHQLAHLVHDDLTSSLKPAGWKDTRV